MHEPHRFGSVLSGLAVLLVIAAIGAPNARAQAPSAEDVSSSPGASASAGASATPQPDAEAADAQPADVPEEAEAETPFDLVNNERLTGDWWGARSALAERGIDFGVYLTSIYQHNARGGLATHNGHRISGSADYELTLDLGTMGLVPGGVFYVDIENGWSDGISPGKVGDGFGVNGDAIDDESIFVAEMWYEQTFLDGKARFRLGRLDVTTDFDTNAYANDETAQFLNLALINTGNIPYPDYGLGAQLVVQPVDWFYAAVVTADAQAVGHKGGFSTAFHDEDDFFSGFEFGLLPVFHTTWGDLPGGYRFGLWYDPTPKEKFVHNAETTSSVPIKADDLGFYVSFDQMLFKELRDDPADSQGLGLFVRYGFAHGDVNEIEDFWSVGAQYRGPLPGRDDDVVAFGFAQGIVADALRGNNGGDRESVYEVYYNIQVFPWLAVTPDLQFIDNPGAYGGRDSFVAGLRVQASF